MEITHYTQTSNSIISKTTFLKNIVKIYSCRTNYALPNFTQKNLKDLYGYQKKNPEFSHQIYYHITNLLK